MDGRGRNRSEARSNHSAIFQPHTINSVQFYIGKSSLSRELISATANSDSASAAVQNALCAEFLYRLRYFFLDLHTRIGISPAQNLDNLADGVAPIAHLPD